LKTPQIRLDIWCNFNHHSQQLEGENKMHRIDNLQYANWSEKIFRQMREGSVDAVHVTITYHENF
jgi:hypothetical protein